jgi:Uma2 family endonuclease
MATQVVTQLPIHRFDVDTYNNMVELGALEGQSVELLEGLLVDKMSPQSPGHAAVIKRLADRLSDAPASLSIQLPLEVRPDSVPEPDLALMTEERMPDRHPRSALLVVEVAVSSHGVDRGAKAELYASAGVPVYWLVDVPGRTVEVRTEPCPDGYRRCEVFREGAVVPSPVTGVGDLDVSALLAGVRT